jgi:tripeptidyl-peptidase-1
MTGQLSLAIAVASIAVGAVQIEPWAGVPDGWTTVSRADPAAQLELTLAVRQTNLAALERQVLAASDPDNAARYGRHLSREQVDALVAPRSADVEQVKAWIAAGAAPTAMRSTGNGDLITATITVAEAERLLSVQYHAYKHATTGRTVLRANGAYELPERVAAALDFVAPTGRFPAAGSPPRVRAIDGKLGAGAGGVTPEFLRSLYSVGEARAANGTKNIVAVASFLNQFYSPSDLQSFYGKFDSSLAGEQPKVVGPNSASRPGVEAMLDIEYVSAMGRGVPAQFWSTAGEQPHNPENEPFLVWLQNVAALADADAPKVFSVSYGDNEPGVNLAYAQRVNAEFQKIGARGISILFSSGDGGVSGGQSQQCTRFVPTFPAGSPWVTAVGGTTSSKPEVCASFSSGGFSDYWARPSYQSDAVATYLSTAGSSAGFPDASRYNATGAGIPDVAAQGENVEIVIDGRTSGVAGTSCSSPIFGGLVALLNEQRLAAGKSTLGYLNPLLYKNPGAFTDITSGSNPGCGTKGFPAAKGWDPVTGLGSPKFDALSKIVAGLP